MTLRGAGFAVAGLDRQFRRAGAEVTGRDSEPEQKFRAASLSAPARAEARIVRLENGILTQQEALRRAAKALGPG